MPLPLGPNITEGKEESGSIGQQPLELLEQGPLALNAAMLCCEAGDVDEQDWNVGETGLL
jgi:hypothetical protein